MPKVQYPGHFGENLFYFISSKFVDWMCAVLSRSRCRAHLGGGEIRDMHGFSAWTCWGCEACDCEV